MVLKVEIILDYLGGPNVITIAFENGEGQKSQSGYRYEDAALLDLKRNNLLTIESTFRNKK